MRNLLVILLFCFSAPQLTISQITPTTLDSIMVLPSNPTTSDFIRVVKLVGTSTMGQLISNSSWVGSSQVIINACYHVSVFASPDIFYDTVDVGYVPAGNYDLNYLTDFTWQSTYCGYDAGSLFHSTPLVVIDDLALDEIDLAKCTVAPNPSNGFIQIDGIPEERLKSLYLLDLNGRLISTFEPSTNLFLNVPSGTYLLRIINKNDSAIVKRIIIN